MLWLPLLGLGASLVRTIVLVGILVGALYYGGVVSL